MIDPTDFDCHWLGVYLTNTCNGSCAFCFKRHGHPRPLRMTEEAAATFAAWADRNNVDTITVAGGEPTTHPDFVARIAGFRKGIYLVDPIRIISNLLCDEDKLEGLRGTRVLANANALETRDRDRFLSNLKALYGRCGMALSFTLYSVDQPEDSLLECVEKLGIKNVRLDLARASILSTKNRHVTMEGLGALKPKFLALALKLCEMGVEINFDCPLPSDFLSPEELRQIRPHGFKPMDPSAHICDHLYVNPDLSISACPHQIILDRRLDSFATFRELREAVDLAKLAKLAEEGVDRERACLCEAERFITKGA